MAPAYAVPRMLDRAGLALEDFDFYEIHEAFASQVLCTLKAWEDEEFCRERLGLDGPLGSIDRDKLNVHGGSLARGSPVRARPAAGSSPAWRRCLHEKGSGRGADLDLRRRRPRRHRDHGGGGMSDRYQQLVNTPVGKIVSKQIGLPAPAKLERYRARPGGDHRARAARWRRAAHRTNSRVAHHARRRGVGARDGADRPDVQGTDPRRDRDRLHGEAPRGIRVLAPRDPQAARLRARARARHPTRKL